MGSVLDEEGQVVAQVRGTRPGGAGGLMRPVAVGRAARRSYEKPALTGLGLLRDRTQWSSGHHSDDGGEDGGWNRVQNNQWPQGS